MYNEEASNMMLATGFALLSIDGTPSTALGPKWVWKQLV
jgi:hypothetical protein